MDLRLIYAIILTILPVTELRVGLPLAVSYAIKENVPVFPIFLLIVLLNILLIFFIFFFLDYIHRHLIIISTYKKMFNLYLKSMQRKIESLENKHGSLVFVMLFIFVAIPLPGTGAYTGCLLAWILGLERKKSIVSIALGVIVAGLIVFGLSLGILKGL